MKQLRKIRAFLNRGKLSSLFVMLVAVFALYMTITNSAFIYNQYYSYRVLKNSKIKNAYVYGIYPSDVLLVKGQEAVQDEADKSFEIIKNSRAVEKVYNIRGTGTFKYNELFFAIVLYDPEFLDIFPMLKNMV